MAASVIEARSVSENDNSTTEDAEDRRKNPR